MIKKNLTKLVGLKQEEFDYFVQSGQIKLQPARLIPTLKTGDEMALTSIFLATINLVKEFRDNIFKQLKLSRNGKVYYYTEASFPEISKCRLDGLIVVVLKGVITDAVFFEMKNRNNPLELNQIEVYIDICKKLNVGKLVTISNEFVADPSHSPLAIKTPKSISLSHFSWTYLITIGQLLIFKKEQIIQDEDQVEIMREVLHYLENPVSGTCGYSQMKSGWKELAENVRAQKPLRATDEYINDAVVSWYEEEKDLALLFSRKLGVMVRSSLKNADSLKNDIKRLVKDNHIIGTLTVKDAVSDIKLTAEFERRTVIASVKVIPPMNRGTVARITWLNGQLENCRKKNAAVFEKIMDSIWIEADIKYAKEHLKVKLAEIGNFPELTKGKDIQSFNVVMISGFGANFASTKKFIVLFEQMALEFYEGVVQHLTNWKPPAPKLEKETESISIL